MGRLHSGRDRGSRRGDADLPSVLEELRAAFRVPADDLTQRRHLAAIYRAARREQRIRGSRRLLAASSVAVAVTIGTGGLAAAGMLPSPVARLLDFVLSPVGIDVPGLPETDRAVRGGPEHDRNTVVGAGSEDVSSGGVDRRDGSRDRNAREGQGSTRANGGAGGDADIGSSKSRKDDTPGTGEPPRKGGRDDSPAQTAPGQTVDAPGSRNGDSQSRSPDQTAGPEAPPPARSRRGGKSGSTTTTTTVDVPHKPPDTQTDGSRQGNGTPGSGGAPRS